MKSSIATVLICRFLTKKRLKTRDLGSCFYVPKELELFANSISEDSLPQQNPYKLHKGIELFLPNYLWEFTEDLSGFLNGSKKRDCSEAQKWVQSLKYDDLGSMFYDNRQCFHDWFGYVLMCGLSLSAIYSEEMSLIENFVGPGVWQRMLKIKNHRPTNFRIYKC